MKIPADFPVQPLKPGENVIGRATCGVCGLSWDDAKATEWTPAPSGRCPFEYFHESEHEVDVEGPSHKVAAPAPECACDLRTKLVGDGCEACNPELAKKLAAPAPYVQYRRTAIAEMTDWTPDMDMTGVSVSEVDRKAGSPKLGDRIARNPANHDDRWLVAADYFAANFAPAAPAPDDAMDAARYRWLRNATVDERARAEHYSESALDVFIDAAMKDQP